MNRKEFRRYKDEYLIDFKDSLESFLNDWVKKNNTDNDKKMNDLIVEVFTNDYKRIKTLSYFPDYQEP